MNNKLMLELETYFYSYNARIIINKSSINGKDQLSINLFKPNKVTDVHFRTRSFKRKKCDKIGNQVSKDLKHILFEKYKYDVYCIGTSIWSSGNDYTKKGFINIKLKENII